MKSQAMLLLPTSHVNHPFTQHIHNTDATHPLVTEKTSRLSDQKKIIYPGLDTILGFRLPRGGLRMYSPEDKGEPLYLISIIVLKSANIRVVK